MVRGSVGGCGNVVCLCVSGGWGRGAHAERLLMRVCSPACSSSCHKGHEVRRLASVTQMVSVATLSAFEKRKTMKLAQAHLLHAESVVCIQDVLFFPFAARRSVIAAPRVSPPARVSQVRCGCTRLLSALILFAGPPPPHPVRCAFIPFFSDPLPCLRTLVTN